MKEDNILEKLFDNIIKEAGTKAMNEMEIDLDSIPEVEYSKEHNEKMQELFMKARQMEYEEELKAKEAERAKSVKKKKVLVLLAAAIGAFALMITGVGAMRLGGVAKYFFSDKTEYSDVKKASNGSSVFIENINFGYVPRGFKYEVNYSSETSCIIYFENESDYYIFNLKKDKWQNQINTEKDRLEEMFLNGKEIIYWEKGNEKYVSWNENEYNCMITTNCEKSILLDIAENVELPNKEVPKK